MIDEERMKTIQERVVAASEEYADLLRDLESDDLESEWEEATFSAAEGLSKVFQVMYELGYRARLEEGNDDGVV